MIFMFLIFLMVADVSSSPSNTLEGLPIATRYKKWLARYGDFLPSNMSNWDVKDRLEIYKQNVQFIDEFNSQNHSFTMTDNKFADMTLDEFRALMNGFGGKTRTHRERVHRNFRNTSCKVTSSSLSLDWRKKGAVGPVMNQLECGSCWAFSTTAAVEGLTQINTGKLLSLSVQQLIDCNVENHGCKGGFMTKAFDFIAREGGLTTSANYPYMGKVGRCKDALEIAATINGYEDVYPNEDCLLNAVAKQPVSVAIDSKYLQFYKRGIFFCMPYNNELTHAVTVVGYGNVGKVSDYWIIKNSWGEDWGEDGYFRMLRNVGHGKGVCGITEAASYPY